jgi:hypothetical protein
MSSSDDSYLLHNFLFHLRTPLYSFKGAFKLAKQWNGKIPVSLLKWLEKWTTSVDMWISAEEKAHSFSRDSETHDWEQIVFEMAENMKDVSIAFSEAKALEIPESTEGAMIFEMAFHGIENLNNLIQPIRNRDFQFLLY